MDVKNQSMNIFLVYCQCGYEKNAVGCFLNVKDAENFIKDQKTILPTTQTLESYFFFIEEMRTGVPSEFELNCRLQNNIFKYDTAKNEFEFNRRRELYQNSHERFKLNE